MGAEGYEVQFSTDRIFTDADEVIERTAEQISYRKESLPAGTNGFLRVRAFVGADSARVQESGRRLPNGTTRPTGAGSTVKAYPPPPTGASCWNSVRMI